MTHNIRCGILMHFKFFPSYTF